MEQNKEEQKKLLTEIMEADAKDGLYEEPTAVDWLLNKLKEYVNTVASTKDYYVIGIPMLDIVNIKERAKEMEKERTEELQRKINDLENMLLELGEQQ